MVWNKFLYSVCFSVDLTDQQKIHKAEREKEKGNEAFRSGDYEEALVYYNRSLSLIPTVACRNNRAQTCTWYLSNSTVSNHTHFSSVLFSSPIFNTCYFPILDIKMNKWDEAVTDCNAVLKAEPHNMKGKMNRSQRCNYGSSKQN